MTYAVDASKASTLMVNQNYDEQWRITRGKRNAGFQGGLIGVTVPAGTQILELRCVSMPAIYGLIVTTLTMLGTIAGVRWSGRRRLANR